MSLDIWAWTCLGWYVLIVVVCAIGWVQLVHHYSYHPKPSTNSRRSCSDVPHVTIIRPVKGLEPYLFECLVAAFHQDYPKAKLTIYICVASRDDTAFALIEQLVETYSSFDVRIYVEDDDPALSAQAGGSTAIGPNPKIRNMSRAYREAKGDIVWILDCNVWVGPTVCGRMVDKLCGHAHGGSGRPYKFVHQLPIAVDVDVDDVELDGLQVSKRRRPWTSTSGGRLEEAFLASSHAKFYLAINTVAIAPCVVGKSNMFRRSHLNYLTSPQVPERRSSTSPTSAPRPGTGIDFFSYNICEDHLIGTLLWRGSISFAPRNIGNHGLLFGDLVIQPISNMSVDAYIARRVRWLRVRKFTAVLATLVEPGTESFLCSAYGAYAVTSLGWFRAHLGISPSWLTFAAFWLLSVSIWALVDWTVYVLLHSARTFAPEDHNTINNIKRDDDDGKNREDIKMPIFVRLPGRRTQLSRRPFLTWLAAWIGRESLTLPIWIWAIWGGVTVVWKDRRFWVGMDMEVHEIVEGKESDQGSHRGQVIKTTAFPSGIGGGGTFGVQKTRRD